MRANSTGNGMPLSEKVELLLFLVRQYIGEFLCTCCYYNGISPLQAGQYMVNYDSTHCVILPTDYFRVPPPGNIQ